MKQRRPGFTLIELLIVIAIIALLISILLPSLGAARRMARKLICSNNIRQISMAQNGYAATNKDWLAGAPSTSGFAASGNPVASGPYNGNQQVVSGTPVFNGTTTQSYDWMGPLLADLGQRGPGETTSAATTPQEKERMRADRMNWYTRVNSFQCPDNNFESKPYMTGGSAPDFFQTQRMYSYAMSTQYLSTIDKPKLGTGSTRPRVADRGGYQPMLSRVGPPSQKAMLFDGHRYANAVAPSADAVPDYDVAIDGEMGGAFSDVGPWWRESPSGQQNGSRALSRFAAPGEGGTSPWSNPSGPLIDARFWAFRHGLKKVTPNAQIASTQRGVQCLGNVGFFDGHVELMDDLQATNPLLWMPTGTKLTATLDAWNSTKNAFPQQTRSGTYSSQEYIFP